MVRQSSFWPILAALGSLFVFIASLALQSRILAVIQLGPFLVNLAFSTGLFLLAIGLALAIWARVTLGTSWSSSPCVLEGHVIMKTGPYYFIRHPIYTGIVMMLLGTLGVTRFLILIPVTLTIFILYAVKAVMEEKILSDAFGGEYHAYRKAVPMFLPKILRGRNKVTF